MPLLLGRIADDSDLASTLARGGMTAVRGTGVPSSPLGGPLPEADAAIVAREASP